MVEDVVRVENDLSTLKSKVLIAQNNLISHLSSMLESKKQELEGLASKDAESIKLVARKYILSSIDSIEASLGREYIRLSLLEKEVENIGFIQKIKNFFKGR